MATIREYKLYRGENWKVWFQIKDCRAILVTSQTTSNKIRTSHGPNFPIQNCCEIPQHNMKQNIWLSSWASKKNVGFFIKKAKRLEIWFGLILGAEEDRRFKRLEIINNRIDFICWYDWKQYFRTLAWKCIISNPCGFEFSGFDQNSTVDLQITIFFSSAALALTNWAKVTDELLKILQDPFN